MVRRNDIADFAMDLTGGGLAIGFGAIAVEKLPTVPGKANIQQGFTTAAEFTPTFASLGAFGITTKQLKKLEKKL